MLVDYFVDPGDRLEDSPFDISDWSVKHELSGDWKAKVREKIKK